MKKYFYMLFYFDIDKTFISSYANGAKYDTRFYRNKNTKEIY